MDHNVFRQISSLCSRLPIFRGDSIDNVSHLIIINL